jgi:hypothetical protein
VRDGTELAEQVRLAKVGMRALVDEVTGFQYVRECDDLRSYADEIGVTTELPATAR